MSVFIAAAQFVFYAAGAAVLYRIAVRLVVAHSKGRFAVSLFHWTVLAAAPPVLTLAAGWAGHFIHARNPALQVAAWDVGLAMWLFISVWACYLFGLVAASLATWRIYEVASRGAGARAT